MKKQKGFTLIELLAVIVILAVIALIATPIIIGIINDAKEKANENSAYGIVDSANYYFTNGMLKEGSVLYNTNILNSLTYNGQAPKEGSAVYVNEQGQVAVALLYGDKCYKKEYVDSKISLGDTGNCTVTIGSTEPVLSLPGFISPDSLVTEGDGLYKINSKEYRYRGALVNNYIRLNGSDYRIVAIDEQGIKVVTKSVLSSKQIFDAQVGVTRNNDANSFCQVLETYWGCNAYIAVEGLYSIGEKSGTVSTNSNLYDFLHTTGTDTNLVTLRNASILATWNIGGTTGLATNPTMYREEEKSQTAQFKIGLLNASDYLYGSLNSACHEAPYYMEGNSKSCKEQNWLYYSATNKWLLNPWRYTDTPDSNSVGVWFVSEFGGWGRSGTSNQFEVLPSAYLDATIQVTSGTGTEADPWIMTI